MHYKDSFLGPPSHTVEVCELLCGLRWIASEPILGLGPITAFRLAPSCNRDLQRAVQNNNHQCFRQVPTVLGFGERETSRVLVNLGLGVASYRCCRARWSLTTTTLKRRTALAGVVSSAASGIRISFLCPKALVT